MIGILINPFRGALLGAFSCGFEYSMGTGPFIVYVNGKFGTGQKDDASVSIIPTGYIKVNDAVCRIVRPKSTSVRLCAVLHDGERVKRRHADSNGWCLISMRCQIMGHGIVNDTRKPVQVVERGPRRGKSVGICGIDPFGKFLGFFRFQRNGLRLSVYVDTHFR